MSASASVAPELSCPRLPATGASPEDVLAKRRARREKAARWRAHPARRKAAHRLSVRPMMAPVGDDFRVDVQSVQWLITPNPILLVGSAPSYPQGVMDPIGSLAALTHKHGLGMHVDASLGGFP